MRTYQNQKAPNKLAEVESRTHGSTPRTQKKIRGQGHPFQEQTLSRPRTGMLEAKAKDQEHKRKCSPKKKFFKKFFQAIFEKKRSSKKLFRRSTLQHFNHSKNSAVLEPRTGQFSRT